jgi:hypothetical protein
MPLGRLTHSFDSDAVAHGMPISKRAEGRQGKRCQRGMVRARYDADQPIFWVGPSWGRAPANSVVDSYGQSHEIPNLWVCGTRHLSHRGRFNPTFTIFALSQRGRTYGLAMGNVDN